MYGSAHFLKGFARWRFLNSGKDGLVIDGRRRISKEDSFRHVLVVSPTGGGKTTSYIIPNVLKLTGSAVITDPSGEIFSTTSSHLQSRGFDVKCIDVRNPGRSLKFNPLFRANTHTEIKKISEILVNSAFPHSRGDQQFWNDLGKNVLNIFIRCLKHEDIRFQNLHNLRYLLNSFGVDGRSLNDFIVRNTVGDRATYEEYKGLISNEEKILQGALSTAKTTLDKFSDPGLCALTATESLFFESLRTQKTAIFFVIPEHEVHYYGFFLSLLYSQIFSFCMTSNNPGDLPVYFLLDEFGNTGQIPGFSSLITTLRKRRCSVSIVLQDLEQLTNTYGKSDASTILNGGCSGKIFFPGLGLQTCEEVERILGRSTIQYLETGNHRLGEDPGTARDVTTARSLLTSDEIRTMKDNTALFVYGNKRPVLLKLTPYYKNRRLVRCLAEKHPCFSGISIPADNPEYLSL